MHNPEWRCGPASGTLSAPSLWLSWVTGHFYCTVRPLGLRSFSSNRTLGILLKAAWIDGQCVIVQTDSKLLAITFIYSMVFDFVVLALTAFKLLYPVSGRSKLVELIFNDGLIYFAIAWVQLTIWTWRIYSRKSNRFLANLIATVTIFFLAHSAPWTYWLRDFYAFEPQPRHVHRRQCPRCNRIHRSSKQICFLIELIVNSVYDRL